MSGNITNKSMSWDMNHVPRDMAQSQAKVGFPNTMSPNQPEIWSFIPPLGRDHYRKYRHTTPNNLTRKFVTDIRESWG